jgi:signal transduction histidine kinase
MGIGRHGRTILGVLSHCRTADTVGASALFEPKIATAGTLWARRMSLRYRLLLVYLIVVLLTAATVGVALLELRHSRQIISDLQHWNGVVLSVERLRTAFEREALLPLLSGPAPPAGEGLDFATLLSDARKSLDFDLARWHLQVVEREYRTWRRLAGGGQTQPATITGENPQTGPSSGEKEPTLAEQTELVRRALTRTVWFLGGTQTEIVNEADEQSSRTTALLNLVAALLALHVLMVGWLLGRWLLVPMSRLNRQVEALARDAPPGEPLLTAPPEMANLALALERARVSLGEMRARLIESERMTALGQFAAQLAHNLRNPLASIRALAQVAARHDPGDGYVRERMGEIVASVDRLTRWIGGLMEVVRREATPASQGDIVPTLHRVREALIAELAAKDLTLELDAPVGQVLCPHDPDTLEHALIGVVVNAIEASPVGGIITIRVLVNVDGMCRISVIDQGSGLPPHDPERIFDSSYSTKQQGMGLGLALTRLALERQGGRTGAMNNPSGGATVYIEIPMGGNSEEEAGDASGASRPADRG